MADRSTLNTKFVSLLRQMSANGDIHLGTNFVYYNPPEGLKLNYPCIVYQLADKAVVKADNLNYRKTNKYTVTAIDRNPDSKIADYILDNIPMSSYDRRFMSGNLVHDVLTVYF